LLIVKDPDEQPLEELRFVVRVQSFRALSGWAILQHCHMLSNLETHRILSFWVFREALLGRH
jgi:hypothetical protein